MFRIVVIFILLNFSNLVMASTKKNIISKMRITNNLSFNFIQTIDDKRENGKCIIEYPKKIWCEYNNFNKKIIVSNGKSLVIKNRNSGSYYIYSLRKTPLELLLDREYLLSKMNTLELRKVGEKYFSFNILENNNEINIFFDSKNLSLIGWQTEDIYQNLAITFISSVKKNQKINNKIFILPKKN